MAPSLPFVPLDWVLVILHRGEVLIKLVNGAVGAGAVAAFLDLWVTGNQGHCISFTANYAAILPVSYCHCLDCLQL